jgi:hypothetical protein
MTVRNIAVERFSVTSAAPFETMVARIDEAIGHPDMSAFRAAVAAAPSFAVLEGIAAKAIGSSGMMEFARFDIGEVLRKEHRASARILRLLIGNPVIMKQIAQHVADAGSYAPVTLLIDERQDGVHLS